jgi:Tol biopolymer transport system component/tRNA A-37 threonylcarbamoyl transferase component Bud32
MTLSSGSSIGTYEILELLGAGGMGEVYRALDSKLKREVAIKVLRLEFAADAQRLARFRREAQILASLNHPHIGAIYDFENVAGLQFLVLELVEGETLADRIARGPIPIDEALSIATQIAEALEAAHEKGIIHRDLKPSNIKLSRRERVKVLDFGLAKAWQFEQHGTSLSNTATMTSASVPGTILGTVAYMSPEQAKGQETDRSSDVWAFGCVLYEMLARTAVFEGPTAAEVLAGVMKTDPDWRRLPAETPVPVRRLLRRCLQKDRKQRLQCIGDAKLEIADARNHFAMDMLGMTAGLSRRERAAWIALSLAVLVLFVMSMSALRAPSPPREMRMDIATPASADLTSLAISPDGLKIVFVADSSPAGLWLRSLESGETRPLVGTENAAFPFWSPDSSSIGFFASGKLKRIDVGNGLVTTLADAAGRGGTWNSDGVIVFASGSNTPLFKIAANGGQPVAVTRLKGQQGTHRQPHFLPDGHQFLFWAQDGGVDTRAVYAGNLDGSEPRRILDSEVAAVYAPSGHLLFFRDGRLFAQPFDAARLTLSGSPTLVAEHVLSTRGLNIAAVSTSAAGPVAYRTGTSGERQFIWFDRTGSEIQKVGAPDNAGSTGVSLSPDARRIAETRAVNGNIDVWFLEVARGVLSRFTSDTSRQRSPQWSPDGERVIFASNPNGTYDLYQKSANSDENDQLLLKTPNSKRPTDWSADGRFLLYASQEPKTGSDLWALDLNESQKQFSVVQTQFEESNGQFSPDGKWIGYESNESGRTEIYVQPFRGPARKTQVSLKGGAQVRWRRDGQALFYIALDNRLTEVPIRFSASGQMVALGPAVSLFVTHLGGASDPQELQQYAVSPNGDRFLMNVVTEETSVSPITVILNWRPR